MLPPRRRCGGTELASAEIARTVKNQPGGLSQAAEESVE
jgi:hypothetical protein